MLENVQNVINDCFRLSRGIVYLVGAGPGDPGLLTLRGAEVLASADLVLYDGLANPLLLELTNGVCERTARTRVGTDRIVPQSEINQRLVDEASAGKTVVRLKGGDPYIFGRGSEEAEALSAAGISFEVVPGITAATAAGEYAGFSFTHRDITSAVAFVTGHEDPSRETSRLNYAALAQFPGTLVFYMGLGRLQTICDQLIKHGKPPNTPSAVICKASLPSQKTVTSSLKDLPDTVSEAGLSPPSLIVVGDCVSLRETASWFEERPLFGLNIGITRPRDQAADVCRRIVSLSGQPIVMPLIEINPLSEQQQSDALAIVEQLAEFDWLVFTSVNGVNGFMDLLWATDRDVRSLGHLKIAAIGASTNRALSNHSLRADIVPDSFRAEALADRLCPLVDGSKVLWARANRGRDVLPQRLTSAGATVVECVVYCNDDIQSFDESIVGRLRDGALNWIGLSSPSIARQLAAMLDCHDIAKADLTSKLVSISPVTTAAAKECGLDVACEAKTFTWDGIIDAVIDFENANER